MVTINDEIREALAEEKLDKSVNGVVEPIEDYLTTNTVTMPLVDFLGYHNAVINLGKLLDMILEASDLNYSKDALRVSSLDSDGFMKLVKELRPLEYVERYEKLLEE